MGPQAFIIFLARRDNSAAVWVLLAVILVIGAIGLISEYRKRRAWRTGDSEKLRRDVAAAGGREAYIQKELAKEGVKPPPPVRPLLSKKEWKKQRDENREARLQREEAAAKERRARHRERLATDIPFAGEGVSGGLGGKTSDVGKLKAAGLPVLNTAADLAAFLGVPVPRLSWLCHHRNVDAGSHYVYFAVPKKRGGERIVCAPKSAMRAAQQKVLDGILAKIPTHAAAHGFVPGRSIVSNAAAHVGRDVVVNLDLQDFFPSVTQRRCKGLFRSFGYSEQTATLLSLLCTDAPRKRVRFEPPVVPAAEADAKPAVLWVAVGERRLPQGACTSPAITNLVCRRLDEALTHFAVSIGWNFTRYADDITLSGADPDGKRVGKVLNQARRTLEFEGFAIHPDKIRVQRQRGHQNVTGLTVNQRVGVGRAARRRFRAILHNCARKGVESQNRGQAPDFLAHLRGYAAYVRMVNPEQGRRFATQVDELKEPGG